MNHADTRDAGGACTLCPRLAGFLAEWRQKEPEWHNAPVAPWIPDEGADSVKFLIVGLAPGLRGANRTGKPFTGDASGEALWPVLEKFGLARRTGDDHDGEALALQNMAITNAVRCLPPQNRPLGSEITTCRDTWLRPDLARFAQLETIVTLGRVAHEATVRALDARPSDHPFGHNRATSIATADARLVAIRSSYHCSRYNMNTGRLTTAMLEAVFADTTGHA